MKILFHLAKRILFGNSEQNKTKKLMISSVIGMLITCTFILIGIGLLTGFHKAYRGAILSFNSHLVITSDQSFDKFDVEEIEQTLKILQKKYQFSFSKTLYHEILFPTKKGIKPLIIKGIEFNKPEVFSFAFSDQHLLKNKNAIIPGKNVVNQQRGALEKGFLKVISFVNDDKDFKTKYKKMKFSGWFKSGLHHYDGQYLLMDLENMQNTYFKKNAHPVKNFEIRLVDESDLPMLYGELTDLFASRFVIVPWDEWNRPLLEALHLENVAFITISTLVLMVACLTIFGFNFLFFLKKQREFLIFHYIGASTTYLTKVLSIMTLWIAIFAGGGAVLLSSIVIALLKYGKGIALDPDVYFVAKLPAEYNWSWFVSFLFILLGMSIVTSLITGKIVLKQKLAQERLI